MREVLNRATAVFLGLAVGDALGATAEFMTPSEIRAKFGVHRKIVGGGWLHLKPGQVTDDTEMSLCIARALARVGEWDLKGIADNLGTWLKGRPRDVGDTCRSGIRGYMLQGRLEVPYSEWHAGNGAVMRMAPVALFTLGDDSLLARTAKEQARLTHNHPLSDAACIAVGRMIHRALLGASREDLEDAAVELARRHPSFEYRDYKGNATGYVADTLRTVLHSFFATDGFEECLVETVNRGGDADTTGAIAGMIAGAWYGLDAIPRAWLKALDAPVREEIRFLADRLARMSPLGRSHRETCPALAPLPSAS